MISAQHSTSSTASAPCSAQQPQHQQHERIQHSLSGQSSERGSGFYPPSPHRSPARLPRGSQVYHPHSSPERTRGYPHSSPERAHPRGGGGVGSIPPHMVPQRAASYQGHPAHRSPVRLPRGTSVPGYPTQGQETSNGVGVSGRQQHYAELEWDSWTAENTHINAAQAVATTQLRKDGSIGSGGSGAHATTTTARLHSKEASPSSRSETSAEVDRQRSFMVERRAPKANPYYSPYAPRRMDTDAQQTNSSNPQLRRMAISNPMNQSHQMNYLHQYPRHSGEFNPSFAAELDNSNKTHLHPGEWRMAESYPMPGRVVPHAMAQMSPRYPRTLQGAVGNAPRMARSPPEKRLKSSSPQRSLLSYSGVGGGGGGATGGGSTSRPNSLHSNSSAFAPHPQPAIRHSDGASAVAWASPNNAQWSGRRSPRMTPVLHVPRSSAHESAV